MAITISGSSRSGVKIDGLDKIQSILDPKSFDTAFRNSANRCARDAFNASKKDVMKQYNIKIEKRGADANGRNTGQFVFQPGNGKKRDDDGRYGRIYFRGARSGKPVIELSVGSTPFPLSYFMASETPLDNIGRGRKGDYVVVEVEKGKRKTIKNAFIAKMGSGHVTIVRRRSVKKMSQGTWKKKTYANKFRKRDGWSAPYAVRQLSVPSGAFMFERVGVYEQFDKALSNGMDKYFGIQIGKLISKGKVDEEDISGLL